MLHHHIMRAAFFIVAILTIQSANAADVCNPNQLSGPYAFQLSGTTTISGTPQPAVSLGRLVFDGSGTLSGTASVTFSGVLLGNSVTGAYEAKPDCSLVWKLQDDSGGYQNFKGTMSANTARIQFSQSDTGASKRGIMLKLADSCSASDLQPSYEFTATGSYIVMQSGQVPATISLKGNLDTQANGTFQVETDCSVHFQLSVPTRPASMSLRGFLADNGKEILAFQTDAGAMVSVRLTSAPPVAK